MTEGLDLHLRPQTWRGLAYTSKMRPSGASTRHSWRNSTRRLSADSSPCTIRMRSKKTSGKGSASSSHSSAAFLSAGQAMAPRLAGKAAMARSASGNSRK